MFNNYRNKFASDGHDGASNRFSLLGNPDEEPNDGFQTVYRRSKRQRISTGGSSQSPPTFSLLESKLKMSKNDFKALQTDDKLVTLFELMTCVGSQNVRLNFVEENVNALNSEMGKLQDRIKLLEYRSIDIETRSRRNNLIFRGLQENNDIENCEEIIKAMISEKLNINTENMYIQRAHRLGTLQRRGQIWRTEAHSRATPKPRPIIVCFRDYQDIEKILANVHLLKNSNIGIHRDYPKEIVDARSELWPLFKSEREQNPRAKVSIGFPAKVIVNGKVISNKFPDWYQVLRGSGYNTNQVAPTDRVTGDLMENKDDFVRPTDHNNTQISSETDEETRDISMQMDSEGEAEPEIQHQSNETTQSQPSVTQSEPVEKQSHDKTSYDEAMHLLSQLPINTDEGATGVQNGQNDNKNTRFPVPDNASEQR